MFPGICWTAINNNTRVFLANQWTKQILTHLLCSWMCVISHETHFSPHTNYPGYLHAEQVNEADYLFTYYLQLIIYKTWNNEITLLMKNKSWRFTWMKMCVKTLAWLKISSPPILGCVCTVWEGNQGLEVAGLRIVTFFGWNLDLKVYCAILLWMQRHTTLYFSRAI